MKTPRPPKLYDLCVYEGKRKVSTIIYNVPYTLAISKASGVNLTKGQYTKPDETKYSKLRRLQYEKNHNKRDFANTIDIKDKDKFIVFNKNTKNFLGFVVAFTVTVDSIPELRLRWHVTTTAGYVPTNGYISLKELILKNPDWEFIEFDGVYPNQE